MRPSKIRVAKYEHSAISNWVVEGLKSSTGRRSRKFFRSRVEADDFARNALQEQMEPYARLKRQLRFTTHGAALRLHVKRPHHYRPVPHLDPALRARLQSALQRPDLKPTTRAKIEAVLGRKNEPQETLCPK